MRNNQPVELLLSGIGNLVATLSLALLLLVIGNATPSAAQSEAPLKSYGGEDRREEWMADESAQLVESFELGPEILPGSIPESYVTAAVKVLNEHAAEERHRLEDCYTATLRSALFVIEVAASETGFEAAIPYLKKREPKLVIGAAMVVGRRGPPSVIHLLKPILERAENEVDFEDHHSEAAIRAAGFYARILEAVSLIGTDESRHLMEKSLRSLEKRYDGSQRQADYPDEDLLRKWIAGFERKFGDSAGTGRENSGSKDEGGRQQSGPIIAETAADQRESRVTIVALFSGVIAAIVIATITFRVLIRRKWL